MSKDKFDLTKLKDDIPEYPSYLDTKMMAHLDEETNFRPKRRRSLIPLTTFASTFLIIGVTLLIVRPWEKAQSTDPNSNASEPLPPATETPSNEDTTEMKDILNVDTNYPITVAESNLQVYTRLFLSTTINEGSYYLYVDYYFAHDLDNYQGDDVSLQINYNIDNFTFVDEFAPPLTNFFSDIYQKGTENELYPLNYKYTFKTNDIGSFPLTIGFTLGGGLDEDVSRQVDFNIVTNEEGLTIHIEEDD